MLSYPRILSCDCNPASWLSLLILQGGKSSLSLYGIVLTATSSRMLPSWSFFIQRTTEPLDPAPTSSSSPNHSKSPGTNLENAHGLSPWRLEKSGDSGNFGRPGIFPEYAMNSRIKDLSGVRSSPLQSNQVWNITGWWNGMSRHKDRTGNGISQSAQITSPFLALKCRKWHLSTQNKETMHRPSSFVMKACVRHNWPVVGKFGSVRWWSSKLFDSF